MKNKEKLYALFGNPVEHSLSPVMHTTAFNVMKIDARCIAIRVESAGEIIRNIEAMDISGACVTIPHKTAIMNHLDGISESARLIGAVNTLTVTGGRLEGDNTDWKGLVLALKEKIAIEGNTFVVLGAGGAARAAVFGILREGGKPVVMNRTAVKGETLAKEFGCEFHPISEAGTIDADCLINCTPVGMFPNVEISPVEPERLSHFSCVMDMIYNPLETKMLRDGRTAGCSVVSGLPMFICQGGEQIRIWTGRRPPLGDMMKIVLEKLTDDGRDKASR